MSRRKQKALAPVTVGSASVKRYQLGDGRVMIAYPTATKRRECRTFTDPKEARDEAEKKARELNNAGTEAQIFTAADRADFSQAKKDVAPFGVPVHVATAEWSQARKATGGRHSLSDVVAAGLRALDRVPHPVPQVVTEFFASNARKDLHGRYRDGMEQTFNRFATAFPDDIRDVTAPQIQRWLDGTEENGVISGGLRKANDEPIGTRRRDNILKEIRGLFHFARLHNYLPDETTEPKKIALIDEGGGEISYYSITEMRLILEHVAPEWLPFVVLIVFNGFRTEELFKSGKSNKRKDPLRWDDFDWEENEIVVREATSKVDRKRIPPLLDITREWLLPHRRASGLVAPEKRADREFGKGARLERAINRALKSAPRLRDETPIQFELPIAGAPVDQELLTEFRWRHNALRHSYGSYRASILKGNVHQLAEEMGTSVEMIHKHYRNPRPKSQARAWFAIRPPKQGNVITFPAGEKVA